MGDIIHINPLTYVQQSMLLGWLKNRDSSLYFEQFSIKVDGQIMADVLEKCYQHLLDSHDILRTIFVSEGLSYPQQVVLKSRIGKITILDLSDKNSDDADAECDHFLLLDRQSGFDLEKGIPFRIALVKLPGNASMLVWSFHHIALDGWSFGNLVKEFLEDYSTGGKTYKSPAPQFGEYIQWQEKRSKEVQLLRLRDYMDGFDGTTYLLGYQDRKVKGESDSVLTFQLQSATYNGIKTFCTKYGCTVYSCIATAVLRLLQIYNQVDDAVVGCVVSGRSSEIDGIEEMVGMLINTLPLRAKVVNGESFSDMMQQTFNGIKFLEENSGCSLAELQRDFKTALFDCIIAYENYPFEEQFIKIVNNNNNLPFHVLKTIFREQTDYNMYISVFPDENGITFSARFNESVYSEEDVSCFFSQMDEILYELETNGDCSIITLRPKCEDEISKMDALNQVSFEYDKEKTVINELKASVCMYGTRTAVVCAGQSLTYYELDKRSDSLAAELLNNGLQLGEPVGIMMKRTVLLPVALFAVMKAGGLYVPLNATLPSERINTIIDDCNIKILLSDCKVNDVNYSDKKILNPDVRFDIHKATIDIMRAKADLPVYILYTSGSTGKPKGVVIHHRALYNFVLSMKLQLASLDCSTILSSTSYSFDIFGLEMYLPISSGMTVAMASDEERLDPVALGRIIREKNVDMIQMTPTGIKMLLPEIGRKDTLERIKCILVGGEAVSESLLAQLHNSTDARIFNMYGPTETTIWSTICDLTERKNVRIGYPLANQQVYVLDNQMKRQPVNAPGELYIAGDGVGIGYWNSEQLTAERFINNPFGKGKMYRTGDIVRYDRNYMLEFLGRKDTQVKIRGHRIECDEVAQIIISYPGIIDAAVIGRKDNFDTDILVCYYVSNNGIDISAIKNHIQSYLPDYMVPSIFARIESIPLTPNGKLDIQILSTLNIESNKLIAAPETELQLQLVQIWKSVLDNGRNIGIDDNFFEIGGHSLLASVLIAEIVNKTGAALSIRDVFEYPTIRLMSSIMDKRRINSLAINPIEKRDSYMVSRAQKRIYLMSIASAGDAIWHISFCAKITKPLDISRLEKACSEMVQNHEILRTTFHANGANISQRVHENVDFHIDVIKSSSNAVDDIINHYIVRDCALDKLFLFRIGVILSENESYLAIDLHHIISDGMSIRIFVSELFERYMGRTPVQQFAQYKDYVYYQNRLMQSDEYARKLEFWRKMMAQPNDTAYIIPDYRRENKKRYGAASVGFFFDDNQNSILTKYANKHQITIFMLLSSTLALTVSKLTGIADVIIGTPVSFRNRNELMGSLGLFINTIPLRFFVNGNITVDEYTKQSRKMIIDCFDHQDTAFEDIVDVSQCPNVPGRNPLFDITFILQNTGVSKLGESIDGLERYNLATRTTNSDLLFEAEVLEGRLHIELEYVKDLYSEQTANLILKAFYEVTMQYVIDGSQKLNNLRIQKNEIEQSILFDDLTVDYDDML